MSDNLARRYYIQISTGSYELLPRLRLHIYRNHQGELRGVGLGFGWIVAWCHVWLWLHSDG